ncbi:MAG: ATP-binding protein [Gammaproteobacteria bacterium]
MFTRLINIPPTSKQSAFIFGPRGTGKTYWLKQQFPNALFLDLLNDQTYTQLLANTTRLNDLIPSHYQDWIIIDEIQKIPNLLNEVHRLIEHRKLRFIMTGSSARALRRNGVNLLAGRALTYYMHPLTIPELATCFDLSTALHYGNLPSVYVYDDPQKYLASYVQTYLKEEVQQESLTRNLALFTRFLETAAFFQGELISYTALAREIGSNRHTVTNFFNILEDLLIAYRLPVFTKRAKRDVISHPKFYYFDVGIYRTIRPQGPLDQPAEMEGPALETLFLQESLALNHYYNLEYQFFYWRTRTQIEVDFVLYGKHGLYAFEIKRKRNLTPKDLKGLILFAKDYPIAQCYLLYGGSETYIEHDIHIVPIEKGLRQLGSILRPS